MTLTTPFSGNVVVYASSNAGSGDPTGTIASFMMAVLL